MVLWFNWREENMDQTPFLKYNLTYADVMHSSRLVAGFFDQLYLKKLTYHLDFGYLDPHLIKQKTETFIGSA